MTRGRKILLRCALVVLVIAGLHFLAGYYFTSDFREREAVLRPLAATNAPLEVVVATAGHFTVIRRGTPLWDEVLSRYSSGSDWDKYIAKKIKQSPAYGHTSTMWMQTWIFLDGDDRLVDFELGTQ